ncbi:FusB/FusC family EF-G-binding protein [Paenibacillus athensensis]|uniref:Elongation factor G-binding protein n=1 Tax=Paenibacillus athensensis TaxID=1967502 RepID=A0A4Y8Q1E3_9BACL|nr:FusB/FusC family EF-G-binding protein [Paenibacillus athensensis]MCD1260424.1 FusB/FusC family EF-G-binding protein [Paenibacillus athensensis]
MQGPFIRNHEYNFLNKQAELVQRALRTNAGANIVRSVREEAAAQLAALFVAATEDQKRLLLRLPELETAEQLAAYWQELQPYRTEFPLLGDKQLQKLFPKVKKLKAPDLSELDRRRLTYFGWTDLAMHRLFMVYPLDGRMVGIEGRFTPTGKKGYCFICGRHEELGLFSAISRKRPAHASPDYYKAIGNYMCADSRVCNESVTDPGALERFISAVLD